MARSGRGTSIYRGRGYGRRAAAIIYAGVAIASTLSIIVSVLLRALPPIAVVAILPFRFSVPAVQWAFTKSSEPVPIPAMAGNVYWNLATNFVLAMPTEHVRS